MLHDATWDAEEAVSFGPFRLVPARRLLEKEGVPVPLGDRAFDILLVLIEHAGELVGKATLMARVWPDVTVDEGSLRVQMNSLRRSLGDGEDGVRYVATVQGRGYRFTAPVGIAKAAAWPGPERPWVPARTASNLPQRLDALIGRAAELAELLDSLAEHRLVTLVGMGGIGKTRLAIELGARAAAAFPDGVWLVDLAPLGDPDVVASAVATVLGVALRDGSMPVDAIAAAIARQRVLLIVDNCEHVLEAAGRLIEGLLERVPGLTVLATSQEHLHLPAEQIYRLDPLALPPPDAIQIAGFGAVALFVERAVAADRHFALDAVNAAGVAEICRRLDGVPLALEMAAARLALLGVEGLSRRLGERLRMLTTGPQTAEARHKTLRNMVEWSYALLDPADQHVFRRLAIFSGSFSLEAAIAVAGADGDQWDVIEALGRLVDKSLVARESGEQPRFRLLETLRLYALEALGAGGERDGVAERHARYFINLFDRSDALWEIVPETQWLQVYRPEIDNVRMAVDWALADPVRAEIAVALTGTASLLWQTLSLFAEGRRYVEAALALADPERRPIAAARLYRGAGGLWYNSDRRRALAWEEKSVALYREHRLPLDLATLLSSIGSLYASLGRNAEAKAALSEAEAILVGSGRKRSLFNVMNNLGTLAGLMNETEGARRHFLRALDLAREVRDRGREHYILINLAEVEFVLGSIERAVERGREAVKGLRTAGRRSFLVLALINLGSYLICEDSFEEARTIAREALSKASEEGGFVVRVCLQQWALLAALDGQHWNAARLAGFVDAGFARAGEIRQPSVQRLYERLITLLTEKLSAEDIRRSAEEGAAWSEAQAVAFATERMIEMGDRYNTI